MKKNKHIGSDFDDFLRQEGILEEVEATALKSALIDKVHIDVPLVRKLIATQFPQWADLSIKPVEFAGWDNRIFHFGEYMTEALKFC